MLKTYRLPLNFAPGPLRADLARVAPGEWTRHFNTGYYEGEWSGVALRSAGGAAGQLYPDPTARGRFADTEVLARCPNIREALRAFACPLESVRLLKLAAGSRIREHRDHELGPEGGTVRLHVPVVTDPRVEFYLDNRRVLMREGETWYLNFNLPHRVYNASDTDRVHLVLDCLVNDWLRSLVPFDRPTDAEEMNDDDARTQTPAQGLHGLERFRALVLADPSLQERLRETTDTESFLALAVELGAQHGCRFSRADVKDALRASRRAWFEAWI